MPSIPGSWIPTGAGSQLLYDLLEELCLIASPLTSLAEIQAAIDNDKENARHLFLKCGEIVATETLDIDGGSGGALWGFGAPDFIEQDSEYMRANSVYVYDGTKGSNEAAINYKRDGFGFYNWTLQGMQTGELIADTGLRTPRGVYINRDAVMGTGKLDAHGWRLGGFDTAIECGASLSDGNCDESNYQYCVSYKNGRFFRSNNEFGLSHKFYNLRVGHTDTIFDYLAGGKLTVTDLLVGGSPSTVLQLRNDNPSGFGPNGSRWEFRGIDFDSTARNSKLLDIEPGIAYYAHVLFNGGHFCRNGTDVWDNYAIHLGDTMHVTINDYHNWMAGMIKYTTTVAQSSITINNGTSLAGQIASVEDLIDPASTGPSPMIIINNLMPNSGQTPLIFNDTL